MTDIIFETHIGNFKFEKVSEWFISDKNRADWKWDMLEKRFGWEWNDYKDFELYRTKMTAGCYLFISEDGVHEKKPLYVGKTKDFRTRLADYYSKTTLTEQSVLDKISAILNTGKKVLIYFCPDKTNDLKYGEIEALIIGYGFSKEMCNSFNH